MMSKIVVTAPGKVHLMGDHAVVYGKPALVAAVNLRLNVTVTQGKGRVQAPNKQVAEYMEYALSVVKKRYGIEEIPFDFDMTSDILFGYHLGSSASVAVATTAAAVYAVKKLWNPDSINKTAYEIEKKQHGTPSGSDNTAVTFGGFIWYRKELEFLKSMWQIPLKLDSDLSHFYLLNSGKPIESTGDMVAYVSRQKSKYPRKYKLLFDENEQQTKRIATALKDRDEKELIGALVCGEQTLEDMGVVSSTAKGIIRRIESAGGAAKILGGGGKHGPVGYILCYLPDTVRTKPEVSDLSFEKVRLGEEGVKLEEE